MFRIAAVTVNGAGAVDNVIIDFTTVLGSSENDAKIKFAIKNADKLKDKEVKLVVEGPFLPSK